MRFAVAVLTCHSIDSTQQAQAVEVARRAVEMTKGQNVEALNVLARIYAQANEVTNAVEAQRRAIVLVPSEPSYVQADLQSQLGDYLARSASFAEAEGMVLGSYAWIKEHSDGSGAQFEEFIARIVKLHESWDAAEPGKGYAEKAAEWRAKLVAIEATKPRSDEATKENGETPKLRSDPDQRGP